MKLNRIAAGIVLYNPNIDRLNENINRIYNQVDEIIVVDNKSDNISTVEKILRNRSKIIVIKNEENMGIARALNQIMEYSYNNNFTWVLSLDQDSVCERELIEQYRRYLSDSKIGMLSCHINDRNFDFEKNNQDEISIDQIEEIDFCITSGSLLRTEAWLDVGGYDEKLFIDKVDTDICWTLIEHGWKVVRIPYYGLLHEIGNKTKRVKFFNREVVIYNHSPIRIYYIVRNGLYCAEKHKKFRNTDGMRKSSYHRILLCLIFENRKIEKVLAGIRGLRDGKQMIREERF